jgi:hypothetical protein
MEHVVIFVCIQTQLQKVLCYSYAYMIFITYFLESNIHYIQCQGQAPPPLMNNSRWASVIDNGIYWKFNT